MRSLKDFIAKYGAPVKLPRPRSTMSSVALFKTKQVGEVDELKNSANIRVTHNMGPFPTCAAEVANEDEEDIVFEGESYPKHLINAANVSDLAVLQCFQLHWDQEDEPPPGLIYDEDD